MSDSRDKADAGRDAGLRPVMTRSRLSRATRKVIYVRLIIRALTSSDSCWASRLIDFPGDMAYISDIRVAFVWCYLNDRYADSLSYPLTMWTLTERAVTWCEARN